MKFESDIPVYGDIDYRSKKCPTETAEQITFFNWLRREYPDSYGLIAIHIRNEGKRTIHQTIREKAEGMVSGAADIVIPGCPAFVCELKRQDHTQSHWEDGQQEYLKAAQNAGAFVCVALGYKAAIEAFNVWIGKE